MTVLSVYEQYPSMYDQLYGGEDNERRDFLYWFLDYIKIDKNQRILDMGAGTGSLLIPLQQKGYSIEGIEPFEGMRKEAIRKATLLNVPISIRDGSFQSFIDQPKFQLIFAMNGSLSYVLSIEEVQDAFLRLYDALLDGGYCLIDIMSFHSIIKLYDHPEPQEFSFPEFNVTAFIQHKIDLDNDVWIHTTTAFIDKEGEQQKVKDIHKMSMISLRELKLHAKSAGFKFWFSLQSYQDRPEQRKSGSRILAVFQK
ncbi:MAG: class I SAM-dependent DNA methyltransferase [Candidatus Kariarchaeaceae archaeon]|jgi:SAM-dependent methyltransferase